jgi:hypothetical protein
MIDIMKKKTQHSWTIDEQKQKNSNVIMNIGLKFTFKF